MRGRGIIGTLLALMLVLTLLPVTAFARESTEKTPACVCETPCTAENMNAACPVCGAAVYRVIQAPGLGRSETDLHYRAKRAGFKCLKKVTKGEYEPLY